MPALTKKRRIKKVRTAETDEARDVDHMRTVLRQVLELLQPFAEKSHHDSIPADVVFKDLHDKYGRSGASLKGARFKEGLSQVELARILKISQSDLSKMENGQRTIGRNMAKRLGEALQIDYRVFLQ